MTRMNQSLAMATVLKQLARGKLMAHCRKHGLPLPQSQAQLRSQAQEMITPDLIAEAQELSVRILTELRTLAPRRWPETQEK